MAATDLMADPADESIILVRRRGRLEPPGLVGGRRTRVLQRRAQRRRLSGPRLAVLPAAEHPTPATLDRLAREYGLKDELDGPWAVRPLELVHERGRIMLVLEDTGCGGEPLNRLLGVPMEVRSFLRLAIAVAAALTQVHRRGLVHKDIKPAAARFVVDSPRGRGIRTSSSGASGEADAVISNGLTLTKIHHAAFDFT